MWGQDIRVIIIPSILALAYLGQSFYLDSLADLDLLPLVMWLAVIGSYSIVQNDVHQNVWGARLTLPSLIASMIVNALVTGLIVFKIFKAFQRVKSVTTSEEISLGITGRTKLRSVIFIIIESGMVLFAIQLARVVVTIVETVAANYAFDFIVLIHGMVNVMISSVVLTLCLLITHLTRV